jgi:hypothetical protein
MNKEKSGEKVISQNEKTFTDQTEIQFSCNFDGKAH